MCVLSGGDGVRGEREGFLEIVILQVGNEDDQGQELESNSVNKGIK